MGKETAGGYSEGEDFVIETETNPNNEIVKVNDSKGKVVEVTRGVKDVIDLHRGVTGTPLEQIAQLEKDVAMKNLFEGLDKVQDFRKIEKQAMDNLRDSLDFKSSKESAKLVLSNLQTWITKLKEISSIADSSSMPRDLEEGLYNAFYDNGWVSKDKNGVTMKDLKKVIVDYVTHIYKLVGDNENGGSSFIVQRGWLIEPKNK